MHLNNLETICLALAKDTGNNSTTTLRQMINEHKNLITNEADFYNPIIIALVNSVEIDYNYTDAITRESVEKIAYLIGIISHLDSPKVLIEKLAKVNRSATNVVIMMLCNHEKTANESRDYLINNLENFAENRNLIDMVAKFPSFPEDKLLSLGNAIEKLDKEYFEKHSTTLKEYEEKRENYLKLISELLDDMPTPRINNKFLEVIFGYKESPNMVNFEVPSFNYLNEILDKIIDKGLIEKNYIDRLSFINYLTTEEITLAQERVFDWKMDIIGIEDYKKIEKFAELVRNAIYCNSLESNWLSFLTRLKEDIGKNNTLAICDAASVIYLCTEFKNKEESEKDQADNLMTVIDSVSEENLPRNYFYESYLYWLLPCKTKYLSEVIISILLEHDIDMSYCPADQLSNSTLEELLAECNDKNILNAFLQKIDKEDLSVNLSSLYFKVGAIAKGLYEYEQMELQSSVEIEQLANEGKYSVPVSEHRKYQDNLTQIVLSIVNMEADANTKRNLLSLVLSNSEIKMVNIEILFELLKVFTEKELSAIIEELVENKALFIKIDKSKELANTIEVSCLSEEELEKIKSLFNQNKKRYNMTLS